MFSRAYKPLLAAAALAGSLGFATSAQAAVTLLGVTSGTDCGGKGGFSNCYANPDGTITQGTTQGGSPAIWKINSDATTDVSTMFPSITGSEFSVSYFGNTNTLNFTYTPGTDDPTIHYFAIKQGNSTALYYDSDPITSGSIMLDSLFPNNPGFSHITFFDTGDPGVPEPGVWALLITGFFGIGSMLRRRRTHLTLAFNK